MKINYAIPVEETLGLRRRLTEICAKLGFSFKFDDELSIMNTFRAHQLIDWATQQGRGHDAVLGVFEAYFMRGENLANLAVLADVADRLGLDRAVALQALASDSRAEVVREKEGFGLSRGVTGVPSMIFEHKYLVTGAQGVESYVLILEDMIEYRKT